jgi:protein SCO1/2
MTDRAPAPGTSPGEGPARGAKDPSARGAERTVWLALAAVIVVVVALGVWSLFRGSNTATPPIIAELPAFTLVERSGEPLSRDDLAGRPWVADFIFTRCSGMCPALSVRMAELRRRMRDEGLQARLVSFSVDPQYDTPAVLREYASRYAADDGWLFVTGGRDALYRLIGEGFRLSVAERSPDEADTGGELITHSDRFVLIDAEGRIRGYYHGTDVDAVASVLRDLAALQAGG